jgi:hypothetical protein
MIFGFPQNYVAMSVVFLLSNTLFLLLLPYKYDTVYTHSCFGDYGSCKHGINYLLTHVTYLLPTTYFPTY